MDYTQWFSERLAQLRAENGVSARDMSLSLGQSESYINKIENRRTMPSMTGFFYICEYFGITPKDFFDDDTIAPAGVNELAEAARTLSPENLEHLIAIVKAMTK